METNTLTHHGVKGMKWGVRKQSVSSIGKGNKTKIFGMLDTKSLREKHDIRRKLVQPTREDTLRLSNAELRQRIERLKMNTEYAKLTRSPIERGMARISKLASASLLGLAGSTATKLIKKRLDQVIG